MDIKRLEEWYKRNHRKLSFRLTKNPYHIWVSEVMLQQTQVDTVLPYFERFIKLYPTVSDLAKSDEMTLMKAVEGLGYYRRFRNMHKAAIDILNHFNGEFPNKYDDVLSLPGVGKYTAGAIMSIAYNQPYSALDGNVIRVLSRYLGNDQDMRSEKNRKMLDKINQSFIGKATPEIYTQAMMELGATRCKPKNPLCNECPLSEYCRARIQGTQEALPFLTKIKKPKHIHYKTLIIHDGVSIILSKRNEELLKGMYEYPQFEVESIQHITNMLEEEGTIIQIDESFVTYKHVFSHQVWTMEVHHARLIKGLKSSWVKVSADDFKLLPMAIAHKKILVK